MWEQVSEGDSIDQDQKPQKEFKFDAEEDDQSDGEVMVKVKKSQTQLDDDDELPVEEYKANMKQLMKKAKHLKITRDGTSSGKNRQILDKDGKIIKDPIEAIKQTNSINLLDEEVANKMPKSGFMEKAK